jgi:hypothetical protein
LQKTNKKMHQLIMIHGIIEHNKKLMIFLIRKLQCVLYVQICKSIVVILNLVSMWKNRSDGNNREGSANARKSKHHLTVRSRKF